MQVEQTPLPLLFMRTVIQAVGTFPTLVSSEPLSLFLQGIVKLEDVRVCLLEFLFMQRSQPI